MMMKLEMKLLLEAAWRKLEDGLLIMAELPTFPPGENSGSRYHAFISFCTSEIYVCVINNLYIYIYRYWEYMSGAATTLYHQRCGFFLIFFHFTQDVCGTIVGWCTCPCHTYTGGGLWDQSIPLFYH